MPEINYTLETPGAVSAEETEALAKNEDHCAEALGHLLYQFRDKQRLKDLICAFIDPSIQSLEDTLWQLYIDRSLDTAAGVNLDAIGALVGEPRKARSDAAYRLFIAVRIMVNASDGRAEDLISIASTLVPTATVILSEHGLASLTIEITEETTLDPDEIFALLQQARAAGVGLGFVFPASADSEFLWSYDTASVDTDNGWAYNSLTAVNGGDLAGAVGE